MKKTKVIIILIMVITMSLGIGTYKVLSAPAAKVVSVAVIKVSVGQGEKYSLPRTVKALMQDKKSKDVAVTWDKMKADTTKVGTFKYQGTISGYKNKIILILSVFPVIKHIDDLEYTISSGDSFKLPNFVTAIMSDASKKEFSIGWEVDYIDTSKAGEFTFTGTVYGYKEKVNAHLLIKQSVVQQVNTNQAPISKVKSLEIDTSLYSQIRIYGDADFGTYIMSQLVSDKIAFSGAASYDKEFTLARNVLYIISGKQSFSFLPQEVCSQIKLEDYNNINELGVLRIKIQEAYFIILGNNVEVSKNDKTTGDIKLDPKEEILNKIIKYRKNPNYDDDKSLVKFGTLSKDTEKVRQLVKQVNDKRDISTLMDIYKIVLSTPIADFNGDGERFWDVDKVIEKGKRDCSDYATLFGAFTREKGIPTVEVTAYDMSALYYNNSNYKKGFWSGNYAGHEFLEVKLSDGKWYLVDSTRGYVYLDYDYNNFSLPLGYEVFSKETDQGDLGTSQYMSGIIKYFINFNVYNYKEPTYKYIDLMDGVTKSPKSYKIQIMIGRNPIIIKNSEISRAAINTLYDKTFVAGDLVEDFDYNVTKRKDLDDHNLIYLYTYGKPVPEELKRYFPQVETLKAGDVYYYVDYTTNKFSANMGPTTRLLIVGNESGDNGFDSIIKELDPKKVYGLD